MKTLEQIRIHLRNHNLTALSKDTGIPYTSIWRAIRGDSSRITYKTVERLSSYVESQQKGDDNAQ